MFAPQLASDLVPVRPSLEPQPRCYLSQGATWPEGPLQGDAPDVASFALEIAQRLKAACEATSQRSVAEKAGLSSKTVNNIVRGISWGSVVAIYQLEEALDTALWPDHAGRSSCDESDDDESEPKPPRDPRFWKTQGAL